MPQLLRLRKGDCVDVLRSMETGSLDAIVSDPPYGLEFMGKDWDSFKTGRSAAYSKGGEVDKSIAVDASNPFDSRPNYVNRAAKRCKQCGKQAWSGSPCQCDEPEWDIDNSPLIGFQHWNTVWLKECHRILVPGGKLGIVKAFSGTRTFHRLAQAMEDAGFVLEPEHSLEAWVYGSGFPKSLNIAKAIDEMLGEKGEVLRTEGRWNEASGVVQVGQGPRTWTEREITAPSSEDARRFDGYGTALKPAWEPIVIGRRV